MNGKQVVEKIGITYPQLRYFTRRIDAITKKDTSQGHEHEFSFRDLVIFKVAADMRDDGIRLSEINEAMNEVSRNWGQPGSVIRSGSYSGAGWEWAPNMDLVNTHNSKRIPRLPGFMYDIGFYTAQMRESDQLELNLITGAKQVVSNEV